MTTALLVVVVVLTLVNLVVLLGVVRRLREHEARLAALDPARPPELIAAEGTPVGPFTARAVDGRPVDAGSLATPALVGFFSPGCDACHEQVPGFTRAAGAHSGTALAVVLRDGGDHDALVADLRGTATVVVEEPGGGLARAFGVQGYPAFALVGDDRTIRARGYELPLRSA
jgi:hypothetical protein